MKKLMFMGILLAIAGSMQADNLKIADFEIKAGEEKFINVEMENPDNVYAAFQFEIALPSDLELVTFLNEDEESVLGELDATRKKSDHSLNVTKLADGSYKFLSYSGSNKTFKGTSGAIVKIKVKAKGSFTISGTGTIKNIVLTQADATENKPANVTFNVTATTGINEIEISNDKPATIYDLKGNTVRKNATSIEGLNAGVYIINGAKVIVK